MTGFRNPNVPRVKSFAPPNPSNAGATSSYGPFNITGYQGGEARDMLVLPFQKVKGAQVIVTALDNTTTAILIANQPNTNYAYTLIDAEVSYWGSIAGFNNMLKRQFIRPTYGPGSIVLDDTDDFDNFIIKARLFCGGKPGFPADLNTAGQQVSLTLTVYIRPASP